MMNKFLFLFALLFTGCDFREMAAPVEEHIVANAPGWCAMYLEDPDWFVYADSGSICPDGREARAVEIWWPADPKKDCGEWTYLGPYARNRWGCSPVIHVDTIRL